jgi:PAS domain S-box-containing protein
MLQMPVPLMYPYWIPGLLVSRVSLEEILLQLLQWVEAQLPEIVGAISVCKDQVLTLTPSRIDPLTPDLLQQLNHQGWCKYLNGSEMTAAAISIGHPQLADTLIRGEWLPILSEDQNLMGLLGFYTCGTPPPKPRYEWVRSCARDLAFIALERQRIALQLDILQEEQEQLQSRNHLLQTILDNAPMGIVIKDPQHRYVWVNRHKELTSQTPSPLLIGKTEYDFFPPEEASALQANDQKVLDSGQAMQFEETTQIANGETRHSLSIKFPLRSPSGEITGVAGIFADITEKKKAEAQLFILQQAVWASGSGVVIADAQNPNYPIILVNPAFERMTGYVASEVLGKNLRFLQGQDRNQAAIAEIRLALQQQQECRVTLRNYRKDGTLFWNELVLSPVFAPQGQLTHYLGIQQDVTEAKRLDLLKEDFLSTVSHELRSPLTNIRMALEMLRCSAKSEPLTPKQLNYLDLMEQECNREIHLITDILTIQKISAGEYTPELKPIQISLWLKDLLAGFQLRAQQQQLRFQVTLEADLCNFWGDRYCLDRIMSELLNNACKYTTPLGRIELRISAETGSEGLSGIQFYLGNTGMIPQEKLPLIFDRFYRVEKMDRWGQRGTGLGLYLVKQLVQILKGEITVQSQAGCVWFRIWLPTFPPDEEER